MDTPLVINNEDASRLAAALTRLTGESATASIVAALTERLARERGERDSDAARSLSRAIAANIRQETQHLSRVPQHGWCRTAALPR
jgi:hypothetical protein